MIQNKKYTNPVAIHPGETLKEWLEENQMTGAEFASRSGKPAKTISQIINGKSSIIPETAQAFSIVTGIPASFWLNMQALYNEAVARAQSSSLLSQLWEEWGKLFPYADMAKKGWIEVTKEKEVKMDNILRFFGLTAKEAFNESYVDKVALSARFRATGKSKRTAHGVAVWVRQGERLAQQIEIEAYDKNKVEQCIPAFIEALNKADLRMLRELCVKVGIKLVFVENIPSASISGAAMWKNKTPLILLSGKGKSLDKLAFNFFHELGHILLGHCNKTIFVDDADELGNSEEEKQANEFASKILFSEDGLEHVKKTPSLTAIRSYAEKANIHPSIVLGHLAHIQAITYQEAGSKYKEFREIVEIDYQQQCQISAVKI